MDGVQQGKLPQLGLRVAPSKPGATLLGYLAVPAAPLSPITEAAARVRQAIQAATHHLIDRESVAELMMLAAVAQEHLLIIGPPGSAKSAVVRRVGYSNTSRRV